MQSCSVDGQTAVGTPETLSGNCLYGQKGLGRALWDVVTEHGDIGVKLRLLVVSQRLLWRRKHDSYNWDTPRGSLPGSARPLLLPLTFPSFWLFSSSSESRTKSPMVITELHGAGDSAAGKKATIQITFLA